MVSLENIIKESKKKIAAGMLLGTMAYASIASAANLYFGEENTVKVQDTTTQQITTFADASDDLFFVGDLGFHPLTGELITLQEDSSFTANLLKFDAQGNKTELATFGTGGGPPSPLDLAIDSTGLIYATDSARNKIFVYDVLGNLQNTITSPGTFIGIHDLLIDDEDNLYVLSRSGDSVYKRDAITGDISVELDATTSLLDDPMGMTFYDFDGDGNIDYDRLRVANFGTDSIEDYYLNGALTERTPTTFQSELGFGNKFSELLWTEEGTYESRVGTGLFVYNSPGQQTYSGGNMGGMTQGDFAVVPEPATLITTGAGLLGLMYAGNRRKNKKAE
jgi:hypothetical protein